MFTARISSCPNAVKDKPFVIKSHYLNLRQKYWCRVFGTHRHIEMRNETLVAFEFILLSFKTGIIIINFINTNFKKLYVKIKKKKSLMHFFNYMAVLVHESI